MSSPIYGKRPPSRSYHLFDYGWIGEKGKSEPTRSRRPIDDDGQPDSTVEIRRQRLQVSSAAVPKAELPDVGEGDPREHAGHWEATAVPEDDFLNLFPQSHIIPGGVTTSLARPLVVSCFPMTANQLNES